MLVVIARQHLLARSIAIGSQLDLAVAIVGPRLLQRFFLGEGDKESWRQVSERVDRRSVATIAIRLSRQRRTIPCRNAMPPPELAADAPGLDVAHPLVIRLRPVLGHELRLAALDGGNRRLRKGCCVYIPLVRQIGLDDDLAAVAEGLHDQLVLDL